jgi:hypothetical protein
MQDSESEGVADTGHDGTVLRIFEFHDAEPLRPNVLACIYGVTKITAHNI